MPMHARGRRLAQSLRVTETSLPPLLALLDIPRLSHALGRWKGTAAAQAAAKATQAPSTAAAGSSDVAALAAEVRDLALKGALVQCADALRGRGAEALVAYNMGLQNLPPAAALRLYHEMRKAGVPPDAATAAAVVRVYVGCRMHRHLDAAMEAVVATPGFKPYFITYFSWADAHADAGSAQGVRRVMAAARRAGMRIKPHYYSLLIKAHCKAEESAPIEYVLDEMLAAGLGPLEAPYRAAIACWARRGQPERAEAVFRSAQAAGLVPGVATHSALLNAYAECGMAEGALGVVRGMVAAGVRPNLQVYATLMKGFARAGDVERARAVVTVMRRDGMEPNEHAWSCVVEAAAVAGRPRAARRALHEMQAAGCAAGIVTYTALLSAYGGVGDVAGARSVLAEMRAAGVPPSLQPYTVLIATLGRKGLLEDAQAVFREMRGRGLEPDPVAHSLLVGAAMRAWSLRRASRPDALAAAEELYAEARAGPLRPQVRRLGAATLQVNLHGHSAWTGQLAALSVLEALRAERAAGRGGRQVPPPPDLQLVTGRGHRSVSRHRGVLREAVWQLLAPLAPVALAGGNEGVLVLRSRDLRRLLDHTTSRGRTFRLHHMQRYLVDLEDVA